MIASFRASLDEWLQTTLTADVYVSAPEDAGLLSDLAASGVFATIQGVEGTTLTRARVVSTPQGDVAIRAVQPGARGWGLSIVAGDEAAALDALSRGTGVIASERLLFTRDLHLGDELELAAPAGLRRLPIAGAFRDFNTGVPAVVMALEQYRGDWGDDSLTGVGLDLATDANVADVEAAVRSLAGPAARVRSSARLEELSLAVFDRTFKVTEVLRVLAGIVAFFGILSALLAIELERARELSVLRTLGFTPRGLGATLLTQTGLLGLAAGLAAAPIGTALALLLVHVINRRSFGWTMDFVLTPQALISGVALAVVAALLAGIYPAWRAGRIELGAALRED
jgi:putative ABC transport system permease protein